MLNTDEGIIEFLLSFKTLFFYKKYVLIFKINGYSNTCTHLKTIKHSNSNLQAYF